MLISVVTTSFNQAAFLPLTLASIERQGHAEYEHLVFDPGSSDGSIEMLREYARRNRRAHVRVEPDRGQIHAINKGLAAAKGDVLSWLNSDDRYHGPDALATVAAFFEANPSIDVAYGRGLRVDAAGRTIGEAFVHPNGVDLRKTLEHSIGLLQPSLFFRRSAYERVGGLDEAFPLQLDYDLWIRFAQAGLRFGRIDALLSEATVHEGAKSTQQRGTQLAECLALVSERFGYVAFDWIERYAEFHVTGKDRKVARRIASSPAQVSERKAIERALLMRFNGTERAQRALSEMPTNESRRRTLQQLRTQRASHGRPKRIVITSFDSAYFQQGLNLIASLHRTSLESIDGILVYPLALSAGERQRLERLEKVQLVDYPRNIAEQTFVDFLLPRNRAYKAYAMRSAPPHVHAGDLVLWMDAGLSALRDIGEVIELVERHEFFMADHDDSPSWPLANISFIHPSCRKILAPNNSELMAPHLCSCLVGYRVGGRFQRIIDEAWEIGRMRDAVAWPKNLASDEKHAVKLIGDDARLRDDVVAGRVSAESVPQDRLLSLFPYHGHRTQSVLSVLVKRHGAPSFSGTLYRQSNKASSTASNINWQESARETDRGASRSHLDGVTARTVVYHHRGTYNNLDGLRWCDVQRELFVLGNGPSLRGFDFARLNGRDTLGMNAAYRFWDESGFYPTYYACFDTVVQESHQAEIRRLIEQRSSNGIRAFFLRSSILDAYPDLAQDGSVLLLEDLQRDVSWLAQDKITTGSFAARVGLAVGYRRIYLLGIDLNYVEKLPEARADGRALEMVATPESNPNYFFDGYQQKGDRYNPPNRHADMHLRSWQDLKRAVNGFPAEIINLNPNSGVRDFPFDDFEKVDARLRNQVEQIKVVAEVAIEAKRERAFWRNGLLMQMNDALPLIGPFERDRHAHVDETRAISDLPAAAKHDGFMIDVGAHHGSALLPFARRGWNVLAFEPDEVNREALHEVLVRRHVETRVSVDARAVSNNARNDQPFYRSDQSTGISGLSAFHSSHHVAQSVDTVTLASVIEAKSIDAVDFLKVDTEGYDLFVLRGFPWDQLQPAFVECEFEDDKTQPLGYGMHDLALFLTDLGYTVFVSEWHPITRYGIRHDWRQLLRYPCNLSDAKSWGNLLAFRDPVIESDLVRTFGGVVSAAEHADTSASLSTRLPTPTLAEAAVRTRRVSRCRLEVLPNDCANNGVLWTARLDVSGLQPNRRHVGGLTLVADRPLEVSVLLARQGSSDYEGVRRRVRLAPGVPSRVHLTQVFTKAHAALKLQVTLPEGAEKAVELRVEQAYLFETIDSVQRRISPPHDLPLANRLLREGDAFAAMQLYLDLHRKHGLNFYAWNAAYAASRLGTGLNCGPEGLAALAQVSTAR
jgi:FkbM family methyltransferase